MIVQSLSDLPNLGEAAQVLFDTETSGLSPYHGDRICGIAVAPYEWHRRFESYYIPIRHREHPNDTNRNLPVQNVLSWLNDLLVSPTRRWIGHNLKFDINMLRADGLALDGPLMDTLPLAHVFRGDLLKYELDYLTKKYVPGFHHVEYEKLQAHFAEFQPIKKSDEGKVKPNYSIVPISILGPYALEDLEATRQLLEYYYTQPLWDRIENSGLPAWGARELIANEMELVKALAEMEWNGALIDAERCATLRDTANDEIEQLSNKLYKLAGRSFSVTSWADMTRAFEQAGGRVLFWNIPETEREGRQKEQAFTTDKTHSTGRPCYNSAALMRYLDIFRQEGNTRAYDFIVNFREASQRARLVATNLDVYLKKRDSHGRIHGQFHQHRTVTGRLSSTDPNEQNVTVVKGNADLKALEKVIGAKDENALSRQLRKLFIAESKCVFASLDWSQVEYRVAAYLANDPLLLERYRNDPATDYHQATAEIVGIDRDLSKTVNFLSLYGGGANALAAKMTASGFPTIKLEATAILNKLFEKRPALKALTNRMSDWAKKRGYVQNQLGRRCYIPSGLEYIATNYADQGACGDAMRVAIVRIRKRIRDERWSSSVKMILTVHDELDYQLSTDALELAPLLAQEMCYNPWFGVPILSDIEVGQNWGELQSLKDYQAALQQRSAA